VPARTSRNDLVLRGGFWEIRYGGGSAIVADSRGMRYIALLIAQAARDPRPMHARELVALAGGQTPAPIELDAKVEVLDATARQQLAKRLEDLAAERDRACATEQFEKAAALDEEFERIVAELRHAEGSGRRATFSGADERARKAVGKAITEAVARIATYKEIAGFAGHLDAAVRKGQWLSYSGETDWHVDFTPPLPRA
jgi:hypothetical protein